MVYRVNQPPITGKKVTFRPRSGNCISLTRKEIVPFLRVVNRFVCENCVDKRSNLEPYPPNSEIRALEPLLLVEGGERGEYPIYSALWFAVDDSGRRMLQCKTKPAP